MMKRLTPSFDVTFASGTDKESDCEEVWDKKMDTSIQANNENVTYFQDDSSNISHEELVNTTSVMHAIRIEKNLSRKTYGWLDRLWKPVVQKASTNASTSQIIRGLLIEIDTFLCTGKSTVDGKTIEDLLSTIHHVRYLASTDTVTWTLAGR